ncbi:ABC transporter ATP-binding protein [Vibrio sp. WXL103]|uniref:ABC transporter ATP-binding protein n=1 Tax=unclassified Vibrio TaxID=2614977 RepID=UPI003EC4B0ED
MQECPDTSVLQCHDLSKHFLGASSASFTAVDRVNLSVRQGEFFSILGPSGCGKTTLLRMLAGFEQPSSGTINLRGEDHTYTAPNQRPLNMVFQHLALFSNMSVQENIAYGLKRRKESNSVIDHKVQQMLARVDLPGSGSKAISQLSGGQKQRVALARCLVLNPSVLLLDEPLGALDLKLREQMKLELKHLQREFNTTFIYITHDQSEAMVMSDRVAVMNRGRFEQVDTPRNLYLNPKTEFVANFVGINNRILPDDALLATLKQTHAVSDTTQFFVRPESIVIGHHHPFAMEVTLKELIFDAANSAVMVDSPAGVVRVAVSPNQLDALIEQQTKPFVISWAASDVIVVKANMDSGSQ